MEDAPISPMPISMDDWKSHNQAMRRVAYSILRDPVAAEDAAQGAWLQATVNAPRRLSLGWLVRVARNRALDEFRRRGRQASENWEDKPEPAAAASQQPAEIAASLETAAELSRAVGRLPEGQRQVVYLRFVQCMGPSTIADELDLPLATVKKRLERALGNLRDQFAAPDRRQGLALVAFAAGQALPAGKPTGVAETATALGTTVAGGGLVLKSILAVGIAVLIGVGLWTWNQDLASPKTLAPSLPGQAGALVESPAADRTARAPESPARQRPTEAAVGSDAASAPATAGLELLVLWADGSPASGAIVQLSPQGLRQDRGPLGPPRRVGNSGRLTFDGLAPGSWRADSNHLGTLELVLEPGSLQRSVLRHAPGRRVSGTVFDPTGMPVAGASIWLSKGLRNIQDGAVLATTDQRGRYEVGHVDDFHSIGAFARGWSPSDLARMRDLRDEQGPAVVDLILGPGGVSLKGRVVDPSGEGVPHAWIACGGAIGPFFDAAEGLTAGAWSPRAAQTDDGGGFELLGLPSGSLALCAKGAGYPVWNGRVQGAGGESLEVLIQLQAAASMEGTVRDSRGAPIAGAALYVFDSPLDPSVLSLGGLHYNHPIGMPQARADAQGRYRFQHLWPGRVWAVCFGREVTLLENSVMRDGTSIVLESGRTRTWNPVVGPGRSIRGRATYADGTPIRRAFLSAIDESDGSACLVRADAEGTFAFFNLEEGPFTVVTELNHAPPQMQRLAAEGIAPSDQELLLVAGFSPQPIVRSKVRGRILDDGGRVQGAIDYRLEGPRTNGRIERRIEGLSFEFGAELPGRRRLVVLSGKNPILVTDWFELAAGQDLDLGVLATGPGGDLRLDLVRSAATTMNAGQVRLEHLGFSMARHHPFRADAASLVLTNLSVGNYAATIAAEGLKPSTVAFTVTAGQEVSASLHLEPGS